MCRAEDANPEVAREAADGVCKISAALRRAGRQRNADKPAVQIQAARLAQGRRFDVRMPYGPVDWTVRVLHGFWDPWLHDRDVLLAPDTQHPTDGNATTYATAYMVFLAAAAASMSGDQVQEKLTLGGDDGGVFDLDSRDAVTLTVIRVTTAGPPAAEVVDALVGRAPVAVVLGDLPTSTLVRCPETFTGCAPPVLATITLAREAAAVDRS